MPQLRYPKGEASLKEAKKAVDPAQNSVLDPWYEKAIRMISRGLGVDDPAQGMVAPAVTGFIKPSGGPDVGRRMFETMKSNERLKQTLDKMVGTKQITPAQHQSTMSIAEQHPRVMAHATRFNRTPTNTKAYGSMTTTAAAFDPKLASKQFSIQFGKGKPPERVLSHELTHGAQRIGLGDKFDTTYNHLEDILGYDPHPLEIPARQAAEPLGKKVRLARGKTGPITPMEKIKAYFETFFE